MSVSDDPQHIRARRLLENMPDVHAGADNYNNQLTVNEPISFSVIVLGGIYPPYSQSFVMFLDKNGILQLKDS